jgi:hypothetical protein
MNMTNPKDVDRLSLSPGGIYGTIGIIFFTLFDVFVSCLTFIVNY